MKSLKYVFWILLTGTLCFAQGMLPWPKGGTTIYVVKPGDTFWSITERFFGNPFLWPRLWEINPYVDNPHLLRPGDVLTLTDFPVVKLKPEAKTKKIVDIEPPSPVFYFSLAEGAGFVSENEWEHAGTILTSDPVKILLGEGDLVYTNIGAKQGVKPGDAFVVFRTGKEVIHPISGRKIGNKVAVLGEVVITEVLGKDTSAGRIVRSFREITKGAKLRPRGPIVKEVVIKSGKKRIQGYIVSNQKNVRLNGKGDVVYIDLGRKHGVRPGNIFTIYSYPRTAYDPDKKGKAIVPGRKLGKLIVLSVQEGASTAVIVESRRQIENGAIVVMDI